MTKLDKTIVSEGDIKRPATSSEIAAAVDTRTDAEKDADRVAAEQARDAAGAGLVAAEGEGGIETAAGAVLTPTDVPELEGDAKAWKDVLIVANAPSKMPPRHDRKIIVAEARSQPDAEGGAGQNVEADYPKNADAYVGYASVSDVAAETARLFPNAGKAPVFLMGANVKQFGLSGVSRQHGFLSVGPGHPVYVAVNLALQMGAKTVEIHGLTDYDKATLGPWLDKIAGEFKELSY